MDSVREVSEIQCYVGLNGYHVVPMKIRSGRIWYRLVMRTLYSLHQGTNFLEMTSKGLFLYFSIQSEVLEEVKVVFTKFTRKNLQWGPSWAKLNFSNRKTPLKDFSSEFCAAHQKTYSFDLSNVFRISFWLNISKQRFLTQFLQMSATYSEPCQTF